MSAASDGLTKALTIDIGLRHSEYIGKERTMENHPDPEMESQPDPYDREEDDMAVPPAHMPGVSTEGGSGHQQMTPLRPQDAINLSTSQKLVVAGQAVKEIGLETAKEMDAGLLADAINRRSGVGFETAIIVALSIGR